MAPSPRVRRSAAAVGIWLAGALAAGPALAEMPQILARAAATEATAFDVYFPPQHQAELQALIAAQVDENSASYHKWLTPAQFRARFGASDVTIATVTAELRAAGFTVGGRAALSLHASGSVGDVEQAFGVHLSHAVFADGTPELVADAPLALQASLTSAGAHIAQYTTAAPAHRHSVVLGPMPQHVTGPGQQNFKSQVGPYYTDDLRQAYDVPSALAIDATGVTIGILMNGGVRQADINLYFEAELASGFAPNVVNVNIGGGAPFSTTNSTETHLDIEQSSGIALNAGEVLYNLPDLSTAQILAGLTQIDEDNGVDVVNMSFGGPELGLFPAANKGEDLRWEAAIEDTLFLQGLSQGITFVASSGDHGAIPVLGSTNKPTLGVECPACDPNVIAVGGTNLETAFSQGSNNSAYAGENANDDPEKTPAGMVWGSGGGMSQIWIKPDYQKPPTAAFTTPGTGRTVPDLALHMGGCPSDAKTTCGAGETGLNAKRSGDLVWIGGTFTPVIGTSASSPDIAGVIALMVSLTGGRLGFMNPYIYEVEKALGAKAFHHAAISGNNGHYAVKAPYDMVIGNGTLDVREFMSKVANGASLKMPPSGIPGNVNGTNP